MPVNNVDTFNYGTDIESYIDFVSNKPGTVYFHNLKFDGSFILDYLLKDGFHHTFERLPMRAEISTVIDDMGKMYQLTVRFRNGNLVTFRDSLKKIPMPVSQIAHTYKLPESKGTLDYGKDRPVGYSPTEVELDYVRRDVEIVARALSVVFDENMTALTVSSDSLKEFRKIVGKQYRALFPILDIELDQTLRRAYRGGWTYADQRYTKRVLGEGSVYDVNSLYPSVMYDNLMPYGHPIYTEDSVEIGGYPLQIIARTITAQLKPEHVPCIQLKASSMFYASEYVSEVPEPTLLVGTNIDWEIWSNQYDITYVEENGCWHFKGAYGIFSQYIDKWMSVKETSSGGTRHVAKLHLNSLYGKFGSNPRLRSKVPYINNGVVNYWRTEYEEREGVYLPVAIFVTAYARQKTIMAAQDNYKNFAYADTDSLHLLGTDYPNNLDIHPSAPGAWKHEYNFDRAIYIRAKQYAEDHDGHCEVHIAGAPATITERLTIEQLVDGAVFHGKLVPQSVPGGIVLTETTFTLTF